jgi:hypothetical protein
MYTLLELSKKFKEVGFEKESEYFRQENNSDKLIKKGQPYLHYLGELYPAYDILNDLCVKYAKEVFGEVIYECVKCKDRFGEDEDRLLFCKKCSNDDAYLETKNRGWEHCQEQIFGFIKQNKPQKEIENYIVANSILFKK